MDWFFSRVGFQKCSQIACTNRFIVTLVAFKQFFFRVSFQMSPRNACINRCKVALVTFVWIITLIASFLHSKQLDLSDGVWPSHHLTDVEQPSKPIKYEGIPKNHQQTIEHDGYPQPFHSKVIVALRTIKKDLSIWQHLPCLIFKILQSRFIKLSIRQKQALLCLIFKIWWSRFRKM